MDEGEPSCHLQAVKLFNILHQVAPSSWICEDVIGRGLVADVEVGKRKYIEATPVGPNKKVPVFRVTKLSKCI